MHKNYQPIKPASNKLLIKRWDSNSYDMHRRKVKSAKPVVDTKSPSTYVHLQYKLKKVQLEEERHATIDRDNRILLEKMSAIMRTRGRVDNWNDYQPKSLNKNKRTRELIRVTLENQKILARIQSKKPQYTTTKWDNEWNETKRYMNYIRKYPENWYQLQQSEREKTRTSRAASKRSTRQGSKPKSGKSTKSAKSNKSGKSSPNKAPASESKKESPEKSDEPVKTQVEVTNESTDENAGPEKDSESSVPPKTIPEKESDAKEESKPAEVEKAAAVES